MRRLTSLFLMMMFAWSANAGDLRFEPSSREEFLMFWDVFKQAIEANDVEKVIPLTEFPFTTRGVMDQDPEVTYTPDTFKLLWPRLMNMDVPTAELPTTARESLLVYSQWNEQEILGGWTRAGDLQFRKRDGKWKLYYAYVEPLKP